MLGFHAEGLSEAITIDPEELADARWFSRAKCLDPAAHGFALPRADSHRPAADRGLAGARMRRTLLARPLAALLLLGACSLFGPPGPKLPPPDDSPDAQACRSEARNSPEVRALARQFYEPNQTNVDRMQGEVGRAQSRAYATACGPAATARRAGWSRRFRAERKARPGRRYSPADAWQTVVYFWESALAARRRQTHKKQWRGSGRKVLFVLSPRRLFSAPRPSSARCRPRPPAARARADDALHHLAHQRRGRRRPPPPAPRTPARHAPAAASAPRGRPACSAPGTRTMARLMTSAAPPWKGALIAARSAPARRTMSLAPISGIRASGRRRWNVALQPRLLLQPLHRVADAGVLRRNRRR